MHHPFAWQALFHSVKHSFVYEQASVFASGLCFWSLLPFFIPSWPARNPKVCQHNHTQNNSVISKELKIMLRT